MTLIPEFGKWNRFLSIAKRVEQSDDTTFLGGVPLLPSDARIPCCLVCHNELVFFFQVAFESPHPWVGHTLSVWACKACETEGGILPKLLERSPKDADLSSHWLRDQPNYRFVVFPTDSARSVHHYSQKVGFQRLVANPDRPDVEGVILSVEGPPDWEYADEMPKSVDGQYPLKFLLQVRQDVEFPIVSGTPTQFGYGDGGVWTRTGDDYYHLFNGLALYFFGTQIGSEFLVYCIAQK